MLGTLVQLFYVFSQIENINVRKSDSTSLKEEWGLNKILFTCYDWLIWQHDPSDEEAVNLFPFLDTDQIPVYVFTSSVAEFVICSREGKFFI